MVKLLKVLKWIGIVLGGLVGLLALAFVVLYIVGGAKANKKYPVPVETVSIPKDTDAVQRGKHIATIYICTSCHTENLGGQLYFVVPAMLSIPSPNLTSGAGGVGATNTDEDWVRAIRHGVGHDGRALFVMPSNAFHYLSDGDLGSLIAYIKALPPVDNELPERRIEPVGRVMMALGMFPPLAVYGINHTSRPAAPEPGVTVAYGQYLSRTCSECHGVNLNGAPFGPPGQEVPTPNLTPGGEMAAWSEEDFIATLRTGVTPGGHQLKETMPWRYFGQMTDEELKAVWLYLRSLPALPQGK